MLLHSVHLLADNLLVLLRSYMLHSKLRGPPVHKRVVFLILHLLRSLRFFGRTKNLYSRETFSDFLTVRVYKMRIVIGIALFLVLVVSWRHPRDCSDAEVCCRELNSCRQMTSKHPAAL